MYAIRSYYGLVARQRLGKLHIDPVWKQGVIFQQGAILAYFGFVQLLFYHHTMGVTYRHTVDLKLPVARRNFLGDKFGQIAVHGNFTRIKFSFAHVYRNPFGTSSFLFNNVRVNHIGQSFNRKLFLLSYNFV